MADSVRKWIDPPVPSAVIRVKDLTDLAAAEYVIGSGWIHGETEYGRLQWYAQVSLLPGGAIVATDEQCAPVSIEIVAGCEIERFSVAGSVGEHPAVRADRTEQWNFEIVPVQAPIEAAEGAEARGNSQLARVFRIDHH